MVSYADKEEWRLIPGEPLYEVSNMGNVRHMKHRKILIGGMPYNGYRQVNLGWGTKCVHQLVALTFLGLKPQGYEVSHKDNNRSNNQLSNLEYVPLRENRGSSFKKTCPFCGRIFKQSAAYYNHEKLRGGCIVAKEIKIFRLKCTRCEHEWTPRKSEIWQCPRCKSPRFDESREESELKLKKRTGFFGWKLSK